jgi:hypothetical protein
MWEREPKMDDDDELPQCEIKRHHMQAFKKDILGWHLEEEGFWSSIWQATTSETKTQLTTISSSSSPFAVVSGASSAAHPGAASGSAASSGAGLRRRVGAGKDCPCGCGKTPRDKQHKCRRLVGVGVDVGVEFHLHAYFASHQVHGVRCVWCSLLCERHHR